MVVRELLKIPQAEGFTTWFVVRMFFGHSLADDASWGSRNRKVSLLRQVGLRYNSMMIRMRIQQVFPECSA